MAHVMYWQLPVPNLMAYDPAFAYEIAIIIQDGIKRMYVDGESIFYYLTVTNEPLPMPEMPSNRAFARHPKKACTGTALPKRKTQNSVRRFSVAAPSCMKC